LGRKKEKQYSAREGEKSKNDNVSLNPCMGLIQPTTEGSRGKVAPKTSRRKNEGVSVIRMRCQAAVVKGVYEARKKPKAPGPKTPARRSGEKGRESVAFRTYDPT